MPNWIGWLMPPYVVCSYELWQVGSNFIRVSTIGVMDTIMPVLWVTALFLLGVISPGPNFIVVARNSMTRGYRAGLITGLGIALGDFLYATAGLFGLAALMITAGWLFRAVQILGGVYLLYIGYRTFRTAGSAVTIEGKHAKTEPAWKYLKTGLLTDLSNPKTIVFFASIFSANITPDTQVITLGMMLVSIVITSILWRSGLAYVFSRNKIQAAYIRYGRMAERIAGVAMMFFGFKLITQKITR